MAEGIPHFLANAFNYQQLNNYSTFVLSPGEFYYRSYDRYAPGGSVPMHYFQQDI